MNSTRKLITLIEAVEENSVTENSDATYSYLKLNVFDKLKSIRLLSLDLSKDFVNYVVRNNEELPLLQGEAEEYFNEKFNIELEELDTATFELSNDEELQDFQAETLDLFVNKVLSVAGVE